MHTAETEPLSFFTSLLDHERLDARQLGWLRHRASKEASHLLRRIRTQAEQGRRRKAKELVYRYLGSFNARVQALLHAHKTLKTDPSAVHHEARRLSVFSMCRETVSEQAHRKSSGGVRTISSYGLENRARQHLVARALHALWDHRLERQFSLSGTGLAIEEVLSDLRSDEFVAELDVESFFESVDVDQLERRIGLPRNVVRNVVSRNAEQVRHRRFNASPRQSRSGLSQGSACSPIIAAIIMSETIAEGDTHCVNYADNIMVRAESVEELNTRCSTLRHCFSQSPFGPLHLRTTQEACSPLQGFTFLGYHAQVQENGTVLVSISGKSHARVLEKLFEIAKWHRQRTKTAPPRLLGRSGRCVRKLRCRKEVLEDLQRRYASFLASFGLRNTQDDLRGLLPFMAYAPIAKLDLAGFLDLVDRHADQLSRPSFIPEAGWKGEVRCCLMEDRLETLPRGPFQQAMPSRSRSRSLGSA